MKMKQEEGSSKVKQFKRKDAREYGNQEGKNERKKRKKRRKEWKERRK